MNDYQTDYLKGLEECSKMLGAVLASSSVFISQSDVKIAYVQGYLAAAKYHLKSLEVKSEKAKTPQFTIAPPVFSWDRPIEEEILTYVRQMKRGWQTMVHGSIWGHVNKAAVNYVSAYEMVEKHILQEIELRAKIKKIK
jgi:hypothetical protein